MADFGTGPDDAGGAQKGGGGDGSGFMYPNLGLDLFIIVTQAFAQADNQLLDAGKGLPGIGKALQVITGSGVTQVVQIVDSQHSSLLPVAAHGSHLVYYTTESRRLSILFRRNLQI